MCIYLNIRNIIKFLSAHNGLTNGSSNFKITNPNKKLLLRRKIIRIHAAERVNL